MKISDTLVETLENESIPLRVPVNVDGANKSRTAVVELSTLNNATTTTTTAAVACDQTLQTSVRDVGVPHEARICERTHKHHVKE